MPQGNAHFCSVVMLQGYRRIHAYAVHPPAMLTGCCFRLWICGELQPEPAPWSRAAAITQPVPPCRA